MTILSVNIEPYLDNVVGRALKVNRQALATAVPYIISDALPIFKLTFTENGGALLTDGKSLWKVVCGKGKYDAAPSFTKGFGRSKEGVNVYKELLSVCSGICFCDFTNISTIRLKFASLSDFSEADSFVFGDEIFNT